MLSVLLFLAGVVLTARAGTPCPPREDIYPCRCHNIPLTRKVVHTILSCHRVSDSDGLSGIFPALREMQIDQFFLYDSFWDAHKLGTENKQKLPSDWFTLVRIKEMEVVDTPLASCFACEAKLNCRNSVMTRFTARNSSFSEKICTVCDTSKGDKYSWIGCLSKLNHFHFSNSKLSTIRKDFFPLPMNELSILNLTNNQISKIDTGAFANLPRLKSLDLSRNLLQELTRMFNGAESSLEFLDLSYNSLIALGPDLIPTMPKLKTLNAHRNLIEKLPEKHWKPISSALWNVDLRGNPLHCDCGIVWINRTFHVSATIQGFCVTPDEYDNMPLRRASRYLGARCDTSGSVGTRKKPDTTPSL